jgi:hypothetical protein
MPFQKGQPRPENGGRQPGSENKITADVKAMVLGALSQAGGEDYLLDQANDNPRAFLSLLGRIIPLQLTGKGDEPLFPPETDRSKLALVLLTIIRGDADEEKPQ